MSAEVRILWNKHKCESQQYQMRRFLKSSNMKSIFYKKRFYGIVFRKYNMIKELRRLRYFSIIGDDIKLLSEFPRGGINARPYLDNYELCIFGNVKYLNNQQEYL